jgi:hypothetical protein
VGKWAKVPANPHKYWVFSGPVLILKVGQNRQKWAKSPFLHSQKSPKIRNFSQVLTTLTQKPIFHFLKVGQKITPK